MYVQMKACKLNVNFWIKSLATCTVVWQAIKQHNLYVTILLVDANLVVGFSYITKSKYFLQITNNTPSGMFAFLKKSLLGGSLEDGRKLAIEKNIADTYHDLQLITSKNDKQNLNKNFETPSKSNAKTESPNDIRDSDCYRKIGIITKLGEKFGLIDEYHYFHFNMVAESLLKSLKVGIRVEYLAYKGDHDDQVNIIKIMQIPDDSWDKQPMTEQQLKEEVKKVKDTEPSEYFATMLRSYLGIVVECKDDDDILVVEAHKTIEISYKNAVIDFKPRVGDRVIMCCKTQRDESFLDKDGEALTVESVHPERKRTEKNCKVIELTPEWGIIQMSEDKCYFYTDVIPSECKLNVGDVVDVDYIDCEKINFCFRAITLVIVHALGASSDSAATKKIEDKENAISVSDYLRCVFQTIGQEQELEVLVKNNCDGNFEAVAIKIDGMSIDTQLQLIEPETNAVFQLPAFESHTIRFKVRSNFYGNSRAMFQIVTNGIKIIRTVNIYVGKGAREKHNDSGYSKNISALSANYNQKILRHYANDIMSKKYDVVSGERVEKKRRFVALRLESYEVPERLRRIYLTTINRKEMTCSLENIAPCLKEELNADNYSTRFHTLLYLEEIQQVVNFRDYDRDRAHFIREGEYLALKIENLAERRPSLVLGDSVRAITIWHTEDAPNIAYEGVIHKVLFDQVLLKFNPNFQSKYNGEDYQLQFHFSRYGIRKQHYAISHIIKNAYEEFLFPTELKPVKKDIQLNVQLDDNGRLLLNGHVQRWYNPHLNIIQKRAIVNILRGEMRDYPYIIFGPPGTGKTVTIVEAVLHLSKLSDGTRLLVGTPSNSSADLIATRLIESGQLVPGDFVRLVSQNLVERDLIPEHLAPYCATIDIGIPGTCGNNMIVTESGVKLRCQKNVIGRHRITIGTCATLGNFLQLGFRKDHFTHVLVDESGQCTEPEIMVPICLVAEGRGQVILVGDPQQLHAIVLNNIALSSGLGLSFMERILRSHPYRDNKVKYPTTSGYDPRLVTKLLYNYRAIPSILEIYNKLFYKSELIPELNETDSREVELLRDLDSLLKVSTTRPKTHGVFFFGVRCNDLQEKDSPSWYNPDEARNVFLFTLRLYKKDIPPKKIGIITPYSKQVKHLRSLFLTAVIEMPKIGSVEEFQGQERDIILISTVRSSQNRLKDDLMFSLGFVQCSKRMNVAISRARYLMVIFGNPHLLCLDPNWSSLIQYCVDKDAYVGCDLPEYLN